MLFCTVFAPPLSDADPGYSVRAMTMMPGVGGHPRFQAREAAEEYFGSAASLSEAAELRRSLYVREQGVQFEVGTVALYQLGVWHRGTPVNPGRRRIVHTIVFRSAEADWIQCRAGGSWPRSLRPESSAVLDTVLAEADETQRSAVGYPGVTHSMWSGRAGAARLEGTAARYDGAPGQTSRL